MNYPHTLNLKVDKIFGQQNIQITLYSGLTTFVGTNASGKTQTLKTLRDSIRQSLGANKVRYLIIKSYWNDGTISFQNKSIQLYCR